MKFILEASSKYTRTFEDLLEFYKELGEALPVVEHFASQLQNKALPHIQKVMESIFSDILKFHHTAYKYFQRKREELKQKFKSIFYNMLTCAAWKRLVDATWQTYRTRFQPIISDIRRRKELIESGANAVQFQMLEKSLAIAEVESQRQGEVRDREAVSYIRQWLDAALVQEDHEEKQKARNGSTGSCEWVLDTTRFQTWEDRSNGSPLLWIHGIPGAGKRCRKFDFKIQTPKIV